MIFVGPRPPDSYLRRISGESGNPQPLLIVAGIVFIIALTGCDFHAPQEVQGLKVETGPYVLELSVICLVHRIGGEQGSVEIMVEDWELAGEEERGAKVEMEDEVGEAVGVEGESPQEIVKAAGDSLGDEAIGNTTTPGAVDNSLTVAAENEEKNDLAEKGITAQDMEWVREIMLLADDEKIWLRGVVSEEKKELLLPGLPVVVRRGKNSKKSYPGYLASIWEVSGRYQIEVVVAGAKGELLRGQMLNASVTYHRLPRAALLPLAVVITEGEGNSVAVCVLRQGRSVKLEGLVAYPSGREKIVVAGDFAKKEVVLLDPENLRQGRRVIVGFPKEKGVVKHWSEK